MLVVVLGLRINWIQQEGSGKVMLTSLLAILTVTLVRLVVF